MKKIFTLLLLATIAISVFPQSRIHFDGYQFNNITDDEYYVSTAQGAITIDDGKYHIAGGDMNDGYDIFYSQLSYVYFNGKDYTYTGFLSYGGVDYEIVRVTLPTRLEYFYSIKDRNPKKEYCIKFFTYAQKGENFIFIRQFNLIFKK